MSLIDLVNKKKDKLDNKEENNKEELIESCRDAINNNLFGNLDSEHVEYELSSI